VSYFSHADLGGQPNAERVLPEPEGELFHAAWEPRALAVTLAMGATGSWNIDMSRAARETLSDYANLSYYQIWVAALEKLLAERQLALPDELAAGRALHPTVPVARVLKAADVEKGSGTPNKTKVATVSAAQVREIATLKQVDLNANDVDAAAKIIAGTARSMGITVTD